MWARRGSEALASGFLHDKLARMRYDDRVRAAISSRLALFCRHVDQEDVGKSVEVVVVVCAASDGDGCAVHIEFAIAYKIVG